MNAYINVRISISLSLHANTPTTTPLSIHTHTRTHLLAAAAIQGLHFKSRLLLDAEWVWPAAVAERGGEVGVGWASPYEQKTCGGSPLLPHTTRNHETQPSICHKWNLRSASLTSHHILDKKTQATLTTNRVIWKKCHFLSNYPNFLGREEGRSEWEGRKKQINKGVPNVRNRVFFFPRHKINK